MRPPAVVEIARHGHIARSRRRFEEDLAVVGRYPEIPFPGLAVDERTQRLRRRKTTAVRGGTVQVALPATAIAVGGEVQGAGPGDER